MTWGKVDPDKLPDSVTCYTDSTIALPLLTAYALARHEPRPLKRLYDRREAIYEALAVGVPRARGRRRRPDGLGRHRKKLELSRPTRRRTRDPRRLASSGRPRRARPAAARRGRRGPPPRRPRRLRHRDRLRPRRRRHQPGGRRPDLRGQGPALVQPADRPRRPASTMARTCVADWPDDGRPLAGRFWPGPLTLVLPRSALIPDLVTAGRDTVGVRVPGTGVARELIARAGRPIAAPSANRSTGISPTRRRARPEGPRRPDRPDPRQRADDPRARIDGARPHELAVSRILRPGPVGLAEIGQCLGEPGRVEMAGEPGHDRTRLPASPGMLPVHYAPRTLAVRVDSVDDLERMTLPARCRDPGSRPPLLPDIDPRDRLFVLADPLAAAQRLYAALHQLDALGLDRIVVVMPPDSPEWAAVRDRLQKATRPLHGRLNRGRQIPSEDGRSPCRFLRDNIIFPTPGYPLEEVVKILQELEIHLRGAF